MSVINGFRSLSMSNLRFQNALKGIEQDCPPIWFMRQAGRYHSHYQELKKKYTFEQLCKNPELAAETALGPIRDFDFDASIYFNDILYPLEALGFDLEYSPGPILSPRLDDTFLGNLKSLDEASSFLSFQKDAVKATRELLPKDKSLIGFIGGPWTLFTYAVECSHKGHMIDSKMNTDLFIKFSEVLLPLLNNCIKEQLLSGAEVVMIFDTSAGSLSTSHFQSFVVPAIEKLAKANPGKVGYYAKETTHHQANLLKHLPLAGLGYDHRFSMKELLLEEDRSGFVQGNFDQTLLFADETNFKKYLASYLEPLKELTPTERKGWISGLGHGVLPKTPESNIRLLINSIREEFNA